MFAALRRAITRPASSSLRRWASTHTQAARPMAPVIGVAVAAAAAAAFIPVAFPTFRFAECNSTASSRFARSDALYADGDFVAEAAALETDCSGVDKEKVEWIWRWARSKYQLASLKATPAKEKQKLLDEAYELIQQASSNDDTVPGVLLWYGVILSEWSAMQGTKIKIAHLLDVKRIWERAVELHPNDASALHFLGRWEHGITEIDWFSRNAANLIFGSLPPASYESALEYFKRAEEINPGFWKRNLVFMAQCEIALGHTESAKEILLKARQISNKTEEDVESSQLIEKIMKYQRFE